MDSNTYHIQIYGRVQGVAFRHYTKMQAERTGVVGWVKNCLDGSVEAMISGTKDQLDTMIAWFHSGSPAAQVSEVRVTDTSGTDRYDTFDILY